MNKALIWILRIVPAIIILQTLFYKFTGSPEPVHIFSELMGTYEAYGRIGSGIIELVAGLLLLIPRTSVFGAILAAGTMGNAIISHLFILGISIQYYDENNILIDDHGSLFLAALITLSCCLIIIYYQKDYLLSLIKK